jgi:hypothetical protein
VSGVRPPPIRGIRSTRPRDKCRASPGAEGRAVYIGIGTVLAIVLIVLLLIWIF